MLFFIKLPCDQLSEMMSDTSDEFDSDFVLQSQGAAGKSAKKDGSALKPDEKKGKKERTDSAKTSKSEAKGQ